MIVSFADKETEQLYKDVRVKRFFAIARAARIRLAALSAAHTLTDLRSPELRLEALRGVRSGQHSIRINDQYRICFVWRAPDAYAVEIVDYH